MFNVCMIKIIKWNCYLEKFFYIIYLKSCWDFFKFIKLVKFYFQTAKWEVGFLLVVLALKYFSLLFVCQDIPFFMYELKFEKNLALFSSNLLSPIFSHFRSNSQAQFFRYRKSLKNGMLFENKKKWTVSYWIFYL